jgi:hypothetical protein
LVAKLGFIPVKCDHFVREKAMHVVVAKVVVVERSLLVSSLVVRVCLFDLRIALRVQTSEQGL